MKESAFYPLIRLYSAGLSKCFGNTSGTPADEHTIASTQSLRGCQSVRRQPGGQLPRGV